MSINRIGPNYGLSLCLFPFLARRLVPPLRQARRRKFHRLACAQRACAARSGARAGAGVPELQLLEVIPVIAAVSSEEALGMNLGVRGQEKVGHNPAPFAPAPQIGPKHLTGKNSA